jgi:molybdenum cofactor cytidylyltransferase
MAPLNGEPMIAATVKNLKSAAVDCIVVVTGHAHAAVEAALKHFDVTFAHNPDFASGLSSSLRVGVLAAGEADAIVVCLGDMPRVTAETVDRMIAAFNPTEHRSIIVPSHKGQFGNPVLWGAEHFSQLKSLEGDKGARMLLASLKDEVTEIETDDGVLLDADTPEALARLV